MRIDVNGRFYAARATGVQRVAGEVVERLCDRASVRVWLPRRGSVPDRVRRGAESVRRGALVGAAWEQLELPWRTHRARADGAVRLDPANAGPLHGDRRVLFLHDVFPLTHPEWYRPAFRLWWRSVVARSARRAAAVVMFSQWAKEEAVRTLGLDPGRVRVLPQGVEPFDEPAAPASVSRTLERLGIPPPFILAAGSGDARKNDAFLVDVLARLHAAIGEAPTLVVVGRPYRHVHGAGRLRDRGARVLRPGFVDDGDLRALYTAARAFCFPSRAEGFGRPPLEAMACGAPVLSAEYGCAREVLGDAAVLLPLEAGAWADALAGVLAEEAEARERRAAAGRAHAARFRWDAAVDGVLEVCREVAAGSATAVAVPASRGRAR